MRRHGIRRIAGQNCQALITSFLAWTSAPAVMRVVTQSVWPAEAASISAFWPSCSAAASEKAAGLQSTGKGTDLITYHTSRVTLSFTLKLVPLSIRPITVCKFPDFAALIISYAATTLEQQRRVSTTQQSPATKKRLAAI
jgi:hypothetical protein